MTHVKLLAWKSRGKIETGPTIKPGKIWATPRLNSYATQIWGWSQYFCSEHYFLLQFFTRGLNPIAQITINWPVFWQSCKFTFNFFVNVILYCLFISLLVQIYRPFFSLVKLPFSRDIRFIWTTDLDIIHLI